MTITHSPGPLGEPSPNGPGFRTNTAAQIQRFHHPTTRALLASENLTTTALEHLLADGLSVRVIRQDEVPARVVPAFIAGVLQLRVADRALIRRSCLATPEQTVSINYVAAVAQPAHTSGLADLGTSIGHGLIARGLSQRRRILWAGARTWPDGRACAARAYVMSLGDRPVCWIREAFNPDIVPAQQAMVWLPEPELRDEPDPAERDLTWNPATAPSSTPAAGPSRRCQS
ncbi:hypothetical protein KO481_24655 [Nocardia sp. NEAU-G5]|uniref:Chorismate lyase n=1 Tax=Nocardia albiluteola TaxID=2842303 RepID=A0ABS6B345_9NOCA|nr:hypothetical protein [Nocardia albiluteola]MBU3064707.1 hypothetical protein [Nocardia albiluteola]